LSMNGQPRMENKQFKLIGVNKIYKWGDNFGNLIKEAEAELRSRVGEIPNAVNPSERIKCFYSETEMKDGYNYLECVEVADISVVPEGLTGRTLAQSDFAVFQAKEGTGGEYARHTWLPQSEYKENFNVFGDLEIKNLEDGSNEFWLPVEPKN